MKKLFFVFLMCFLLLNLSSFAQSLGTLYITSNIPFIRITIDGEEWNKSSVKTKIEPGSHIVTASYRFSEVPFFQETVKVAEGQTTSLLVEDKPRNQTITETKNEEIKNENKKNQSQKDENIRMSFCVDAKSATYRAMTSGVDSSATLDSMIGLGFLAKFFMQNQWSVLFGGQYNTSSGFTNANATKTTLIIYPFELNMQREFEGWYLGGGFNYSLWGMSASGVNYDTKGGIGGQVYVGWPDLFMKNTDLSLIYDYFTASTNISGIVINQTVGTLALGTKIWF